MLKKSTSFTSGHERLSMEVSHEAVSIDDMKTIVYPQYQHQNQPRNQYPCDPMYVLTAVESGSDGKGDYGHLRNLFHANPLKWCQLINFLVQLYDDMGHPALKPNIISLAAEYILELANNHQFDSILAKKTNDGDSSDLSIRRNELIRMAVWMAIKNEGFEMDTTKLFDLGYGYCSKPMVSSNNKEIENSVKCGNGINRCQVYGDDEKDEQDEQMVDGLCFMIKEIDFCRKMDWKFDGLTRYQNLIELLKELGFNTGTIVFQSYQTVEVVYNEVQTHCKRTEFSEDVKFCFLCRFLLEMTYYKADLHSVSGKVNIAVLYGAFIICSCWSQKFDFTALYGKYELLNHKHRIDDVMYKLIAQIISIGCGPNSCATYCQFQYIHHPVTNGQSHYHLCKCILNCSLNIYLKYSKKAFCEISRIPFVSTSDMNDFIDFYDDSNGLSVEAAKKPSFEAGCSLFSGNESAAVLQSGCIDIASNVVCCDDDQSPRNSISYSI